MEGDLLNGPGQYSLLILALACVTYIRSVPYPKCIAALASNKTGEWKQKWAAVQAIILDLMQLAFAAIGVLILGRNIIWGTAYDFFILRLYFWLVCIFMLFHLVVNVMGIVKALKKLL